MAETPSRYYVNFALPLISPSSEYNQLYVELVKYFLSIAKVKSDKLYLNYAAKCGKLYYKDIKTLQLVIDTVNQNNIKNIVFNGSIIADKPGILKNNTNTSGITAEMTGILINENEDQIPLLEGPNDQYISVTDAQKSGCQLFHSVDDSQKKLQDELLAFLQAQSSIFFDMKKLKYKVPDDITIDIQFKFAKRTATENSPLNTAGASTSRMAESESRKLVSINNGSIKNQLTPRQMISMRNKSQSDSNNQIINSVARPHNQLNGTVATSLPPPNATQPTAPKLAINSTSNPKPSVARPNNQLNGTVAASLPSPMATQPTAPKVAINSTPSPKPSVARPNNQANGTVAASLLSPMATQQTASNVAINSTPNLKPLNGFVRKINALPVKATKLLEYPTGSAYVDKMDENCIVQIEVLAKQSDTTFCVFVMCPKFMEYEGVLSAFMFEHEILTPSVGDVVMVKTQDEPSRAYILELLPNGKFKVAAFDYARVEDVDAVYELSEELRGFDEFVCICEAPAAYVKTLELHDAPEFIVKDKNLFLEKDLNIPIKATRWNPLTILKQESQRQQMPKLIEKVPQKIFNSLPTDKIPLELKEKVNFCGLNNGVLYLRNKATRQKIVEMNKELMQSGVDPLEKPPVVGQYVLYKCGNEYRRSLVKEVTSINDTIFINIEFIDYFNDCKTIPANATDVWFNLTISAIFGPTLILARLRYFEEKIFSENALQYISGCTSKKYDVCYLDGDVVDLGNDENICLSKILLDLDLPKIKTVKDLPQINLSLNIEMAVTVFHIDGEVIYFSPVQISQSTNFIDALENLGDIEDIGELCKGQLGLAMYEELWSRCEVVEVIGNEAKVHFIDFGNTETYPVNDIKALPDDLLNYGAITFKGTLTTDSMFYGTPEEAKMETVVARLVGKDQDLHHIKIVRCLEVTEDAAN